jgi:hypothetical protein
MKYKINKSIEFSRKSKESNFVHMLDNDQNKMEDLMKKSFYYRNKFKLDAF